MKRSIQIAIAGTVLTCAGVLASAPVALAYPGPSPIVVTNKQTVTVGSSITISATNLKPGTLAKFFAANTPNASAMRSALLAAPARVAAVATVKSAPSGAVLLGTATANSSTVASLTATIPSSLGGKVTLFVDGVDLTGAAVEGTSIITVLTAGASGGGTGGIPFTGSNSVVPLTLAGLGALAVGGGLVVAARRRRAVAA